MIKELLKTCSRDQLRNVLQTEDQAVEAATILSAQHGNENHADLTDRRALVRTVLVSFVVGLLLFILCTLRLVLPGLN